MSESTDPQTRAIPTPEEMPWSISYLHNDIQALRTQSHDDIQALRTQTHDDIQALRTQTHDDIQALRDQTRDDIQALRDQSHDDIQALHTEIGVVHKRIDETNRVLSEQIRAVHKRMDTYFLWMMGTLIAITGVLIAVIKL